MIRYISGRLLKAEEARIVILAGGIGYEVLLPDIVWQSFRHRPGDADDVELFISFQQSVQQPRPSLIGFTSEVELEFFEQLIRVKDIGPLMASKALTLPVPVIARAIEDRDSSTIMQMKGIGKRKADMIISELNGKVGKYALLKEPGTAPPPHMDDVSKQVVDVLVKQLGHGKAESVKMVAAAIERNPHVITPEDLFEEVYRGTRETTAGE